MIHSPGGKFAAFFFIPSQKAQAGAEHGRMLCPRCVHLLMNFLHFWEQVCWAAVGVGEPQLEKGAQLRHAHVKHLLACVWILLFILPLMQKFGHTPSSKVSSVSPRSSLISSSVMSSNSSSMIVFSIFAFFPSPFSFCKRILPFAAISCTAPFWHCSCVDAPAMENKAINKSRYIIVISPEYPREKVQSPL